MKPIQKINIDKSFNLENSTIFLSGSALIDSEVSLLGVVKVNGHPPTLTILVNLIGSLLTYMTIINNTRYYVVLTGNTDPNTLSDGEAFILCGNDDIGYFSVRSYNNKGLRLFNGKTAIDAEWDLPKSNSGASIRIAKVVDSKQKLQQFLISPLFATLPSLPNVSLAEDYSLLEQLPLVYDEKFMNGRRRYEHRNIIANYPHNNIPVSDEILRSPREENTKVFKFKYGTVGLTISSTGDVSKTNSDFNVIMYGSRSIASWTPTVFLGLDDDVLILSDVYDITLNIYFGNQRLANEINMLSLKSVGMAVDLTNMDMLSDPFLEIYKSWNYMIDQSSVNTLKDNGYLGVSETVTNMSLSSVIDDDNRNSGHIIFAFNYGAGSANVISPTGDFIVDVVVTNKETSEEFIFSSNLNVILI
jgi:hypothetical protein